MASELYLTPEGADRGAAPEVKNDFDNWKFDLRDDERSSSGEKNTFARRLYNWSFYPTFLSLDVSCHASKKLRKHEEEGGRAQIRESFGRAVVVLHAILCAQHLRLSVQQLPLMRGCNGM